MSSRLFIASNESLYLVTQKPAALAPIQFTNISIVILRKTKDLFFDEDQDINYKLLVLLQNNSRNRNGSEANLKNRR